MTVSGGRPGRSRHPAHQVRGRADLGLVLTAPVSAVWALFAAVRALSGPFPAGQNRFRRRLKAVLTGRKAPLPARTVANGAETALTGAVRTGP